MAHVSIRLGDAATTDDELIRLSNLNPGYRFELSATGDVLVTPPAGNESSRRCGMLFARVLTWSEATKAGYTFESSAGFRMPDGAVLSPDVSWVARARYDALSQHQRERVGPLCPDLVIEVRSPSDAARAGIEKLERFRDYGTKIGLLFDATKGVTVVDAQSTRQLGRVSSYTIAAGILADTELVLRFDDLYA